MTKVLLVDSFMTTSPDRSGTSGGLLWAFKSRPMRNGIGSIPASSDRCRGGNLNASGSAKPSR
jgi:hypothetical protein